MVGMSIRPGAAADAQAVARLIASFRPLLTRDPEGRGAAQFLASVSADAERRYLQSPRYAYRVAELDGRVVGFIAMRDTTHLFHLFVAAEAQRKGVGRALWTQARDEVLQALGAAEVSVNASLNAVPVYERFGFVAAGGVVHAHGIAFMPMRAWLRHAD